MGAVFLELLGAHVDEVVDIESLAVNVGRSKQVVGLLEDVQFIVFLSEFGGLGPCGGFGSERLAGALLVVLGLGFKKERVLLGQVRILGGLSSLRSRLHGAHLNHLLRTHRQEGLLVVLVLLQGKVRSSSRVEGREGRRLPKRTEVHSFCRNLNLIIRS